MVGGFVAAVEAEDGGPFAVAFVLPDDGAVEDGGYFAGAEVALGGVLAAAAGVGVGEEVSAQRRGGVVRGEDHRCIELVGLLRGLLDFGEGEVFDRRDFDGVLDVAEVGAEELGGGGPGGEDGGVRVMLGDVGGGFLMDDDHVAVGEVVFRREGRWRVEPESTEEGDSSEECEIWPDACAFAPGGDAGEQDEGIDRQKVAGEDCAAEDGECQPVAGDEDGYGGERCGLQGLGFCLWAFWEEEAGYGEDDGEPDVALPEEVQEAVVDRGVDVRGGEVGGGVVTEVLGVAEGEAGFGVVVGVPGEEREKWGREGGDPAEVGGAGFGGWERPGSQRRDPGHPDGAGFEEEDYVHRGQDGWLDDGGFFGECGQGEKGGDR